MKRGGLPKPVVFLVGAAIVGLCWLVFGQHSPEPEKPHQPMKVYVTETQTEQVRMPATEQCFNYLKEVRNLRDGQKKLSQTKGEMSRILNDMQVNAFTQDSNKIVQLQREMFKVQSDMDNTWLTIGDASAELDKYAPGEEPCR